MSVADQIPATFSPLPWHPKKKQSWCISHVATNRVFVGPGPRPVQSISAPQSKNAASLRTTTKCCGKPPRPCSYVNVHGSGQDFQSLAIQGEDLSVNHHVHRTLQCKLHSLDPPRFA